MEFNSKLIYLISEIDKNPIFMVMWAAFGIFLSFFILLIPIIFLRKIGIQNKRIEDSLAVVTGIIMISWILGFISQMILLFTGVRGLKMLIIWIIMFFTVSAFTIANKKMILKWVHKKSSVK